MKRIFLPLIPVLLFSPSAYSEHFTIKELGVELTTPAAEHWERVKKSDYGIVLQPVGEKGKIRVHLSAKGPKSPKEAVLASFKAVWEQGGENFRDWHHLLSSEPVITASGIAGQRGVFGSQRAGVGVPKVQKYFFQRPDGRNFCVCAYVDGNAARAAEFEKIILNTLSFTGKPTP